MRRWAAQSGVQLDFITHDYQGDPNRPKLRGRPASINHVIWDERGQRRIKPDGLLGLTIGRVSRLFVLELHNESDTRLVVDQLYRNFAAANAILTKFPHYQTMSNPFVLSVYTRPEILAATQAQVLANSVFADVLPGLFFAHLDHLQSDFASAWHYANGQNRERVFIIGHRRDQPRPAVFPFFRQAQRPDQTNRPHLLDPEHPQTLRRLTPLEYERLQGFHTAIISMMGHLATSDRIDHIATFERALGRLQARYTASMEALRKYRSGGQQTVTVQHVNVEGGGQAIVGNVQAGGSGS